MGTALRDLFPEVKKSKEVTALVFDSRNVVRDAVFFAVKGHLQDGHEHLEAAAKKGPQALVVEDLSRVPSGYLGEVIRVKDSRKSLAEASKIFFGQPERDLKIWGVTGTNGKTTCVYMIEEMLKSLGVKTGVMGTINHHFEEQVWKTNLTTPDVVGVYSRLNDFRRLGANQAAMEISSHALDQRRVEGLLFDVGIWTNLTRDHLDYHLTEAAYFSAKEKLFLHHLKKDGVALINGDAENLKQVKVASGVRVYRYGLKGDFTHSHIKTSLEGSSFTLTTPFGKAQVSLATPGLHNISNACAVLAAGLCLGFPLEKVKDSLANFRGAPGRLQLVHRGPFAFVDYAHTPDALASSLRSLKELVSSDQKIIAVFGFGGDRDPGKRPLMVNEALKLADQVVLTSDNPRSEDPQKIMEEGLTSESRGLVGFQIKMEVDRKKAIHLALQMAAPNDVILIAGKGHEGEQIIGERTLPFSDQKVIEEFFVG